MSLMRLCDAKNCWLKDLDDVPSSELPFWVAYYEELDVERRRMQREAESRARARR